MLNHEGALIMLSFEKNKESKLDTLLAALKLSSLFFSAIAYFQFFANKKVADYENYQYHLLIIIGTIFVLLIIYFLWIFLNSKTKENKYIIYKILQTAMFIALFMGAIMITGSYESNFKYLFLFLIVSYTIESGMQRGLFIAVISAAIILIMDLLLAPAAQVNYYFEDDLLIAGIFIIMAWTVGYYVKLEKCHIAILQDMVNKDGLTGLYNHRYFYDQAEELLADCLAAQKPFSVMILDIDHFKTYNDIHGHQKGDIVIKKVANFIYSLKREGDVVARYGGDEFTVIMPNTTETQAYEIAEKIRKQVQELYVEGQEYLPFAKLTLSIGIAGYSELNSNSQDIIRAADDALYRAKFLQKNRVEIYTSVLDKLYQHDNIGNDDVKTLASIKTLIAVINSRDTFTYSHVERVVFYCSIFAEKLGLDEQAKADLIYGAYMHDIGKINISKEILMKTGKLTIEEWVELKQHPVHGAEIIKNITLLEKVVPLILQHHERIDGNGYPYGLKGEQISYLARMLTVVDSFDAMTSSRPYQVRKTYEEAFTELRRCSGSQFDGKIVEQFIATIQNIIMEY